MPLVRVLETATHGRMVVDGLVAGASRPLLVGFHGYGQNAESCLEQLRRIAGTGDWTLVAVQGLNRFYAPRTQEVIASWMTREDRELAIVDNIAYVDRAMRVIADENGTPSHLVYLGFSQGVAMAYRAAALGAWPADGVIALAGDVPPDVQDASIAHFPKVLLGRGSADTWYTEEKLRSDVDHLRSRRVNVEVAEFEGGHEWSEPFRQAASRFLQSVASP
jgi:predicted esterase